MIFLTRIPLVLLKSFLPFLISKKTSEKFKFFTRKYDFNIAYKPMNCMNTFIKTRKDKIKEDHSNVVYKIDCQDCNYSYVRQTKGKLTKADKRRD